MSGTLSYNETQHVLELVFPYDPDAVALAKTVEGYRWNKASKSWRYPATLEHARALIRVFDPNSGHGFSDWVSRVNAERKAADRARDFLTGKVEAVGDFGLTFTTEPYKHQRDYCEWAALRMRGGLPFRGNFGEQGVGKTKSEIDSTLWEIGNGYMKGTPIIICPDSVKRNWVREFNIHAPTDVFAPFIVEGNLAKKMKLLENIPTIIGRMQLIPVPVIGYGTFSAPSHGPVIELLMQMAANKQIGKVVIDEATMVKNTTSGRGKKIYHLARRIPIRIVMTGTPYPKRPTDVFNLMRILSPEILGENYPAFERGLAVYGGYQGKEVVDYKPEPLREMEERVNRHAIRVLLRDCTDLPEEIHVERYCDLSPKQVRVTASLKKSMMAALDGKDGVPWMLNADQAITQILRFNQISSGFLEVEDDNGKINTTEFKPNPKLDLLKMIIADEIPEDDKAVIWCAYQKDVEKICELLGDAAVSFYGKNSAKGNAFNEDRFKDDPSVRFMIATPDAGGYGLNWQCACWCIFYSYGFRWELLDQAKARIRRLTQEKRMMFLWLIAENPETRDSTHGVSTGINSFIRKSLGETDQMAKQLTGDAKKDPKSFARRTLEVM